MEGLFTRIVENIVEGIATLLVLLNLAGSPLPKEEPLLLKYSPPRELSSKKLDIPLGTTSTSTLLEQQKKNIATTTTAQKIVSPQKKPITQKTPAISPTSTPTLVTHVKTTLASSLLNEKAREALVNIFCTNKYSGESDPVSASGVFIDPQGIILTNAHVAENLLLKDYHVKDFVTCIARTGSPAEPTYNVELLYLPPSWVNDHAGDIKDITHSGSGQEDYAFLRVSSAVSGKNLPSSFPYIEPNFDAKVVAVGEPVFLASYPAGFIEGASVARDLWISSGTSQITKLYTFGATPNFITDIFGIKGTIGAQEGSSGGAVLDYYEGKLLGIISTRTAGKTTDERELRILSIPYITTNLSAHTTFGIPEYFKGNIAEMAKQFNTEVAPDLSKKLFEVLDK